MGFDFVIAGDLFQDTLVPAFTPGQLADRRDALIPQAVQAGRVLIAATFLNDLGVDRNGIAAEKPLKDVGQCAFAIAAGAPDDHEYGLAWAAQYAIPDVVQQPLGHLTIAVAKAEDKHIKKRRAAAGRGRFNPGGPGFEHLLSDNNVDRLQRFQIIHGPRRLQFPEAEIDSRGSLAEKAL